jgi:hypothetical protein
MVPRYLSISDDAQTARKKKGVLFAEEPQQQSVEMTSLQVGRSRLVLKLLPFKAADSIGCCE